MPSRAIALITACTLSALASEAQALGFGRLSASAVLGQPLDLPVPLHLDPGEVIEPSCVHAEVSAGETRWGRDQVRARLEPGSDAAHWVARVVSTTIVEEPIVEVTLTVGCERRFSRRFVAFADPPLGGAVGREHAPAAATPRAVAEAAPPAPESLPPVRSSRGTNTSTSAAASSPQPKGARPATQPARERPRATPRRPAAEPPASVAQRAAPDSGARLLLEVGAPRLKLDIEDPIFMPAAPADVATSTADSDAGDAQRLQVLEKTLADLQREGQSSREATGALKKRLAEAETGRRALPWLAGLLALAVGVVVWLAWRLRQQQAQIAAQPEWWAAQPPEAGISAPMDLLPDLPPLPPQGSQPEPPVPESTDRPAFDDTGTLGEATAPLPAAYALERSTASAAQPAMELPHERTMALGPAAAFLADRGPTEVTGAREVSVEELLDLEQQADFFLALGQEDAAIDLLMSHLRSTGGQSPLPYTKLLEIYRRQEDREAYERIRARFNRRFNAYAPDWEAGPFSGRALEDYPQAIGQLQSLWPEPLDAMALLEAMLFRKAAAHELFDLQAYKDVLLLYSLARDLWLQNGGTRAGGVDVLLPLEEDPSHPGEGGAMVEPTQFQLTAYAPPPRAATAQGDDQDEVDTRR
jgi:pilus assembly protein FimV